MIRAKTYKRAKTYAPEIRLARGPRVEGDTGDGSYSTLYGYAWLAVMDRAEGRLRLFQAQLPAGGAWRIGDPGGDMAEWVEMPVDPLPHPVQEIAHMAFAFDQAARPVIAYCRGQDIWVRQWDPQSEAFVMRGPFPGQDPVLINDATVGYFSPDSDVLLVHLSPDRTRLLMRVQRDVYQVAYEIQQFASEMLLDQAVSLPYRIGLLGGSVANPMETALDIVSALYPVRVGDRGVVVGALPLDGGYAPAILRLRGNNSESIAVGAAPQNGVYAAAIIQLGQAETPLSVGAAPQNGLYALAILRSAAQDGLAMRAAPQNGLYAFAVYRYTALDGVQVGAAPQTIVYYI